MRPKSPAFFQCFVRLRFQSHLPFYWRFSRLKWKQNTSQKDEIFQNLRLFRIFARFANIFRVITDAYKHCKKLLPQKWRTLSTKNCPVLQFNCVDLRLCAIGKCKQKVEKIATKRKLFVFLEKTRERRLHKTNETKSVYSHSQTLQINSLQRFWTRLVIFYQNVEINVNTIIQWLLNIIE